MMKLLISFIAIATLIGASLWAIIYPLPPHRLSKVVAKFALILGLAILIMGGYAGTARADVTHLKEADQWIYQSQTVLSDESGFDWQVTALKLMNGQMDGTDRGLLLRLANTSENIQLDAVKPLVITTQIGKPLAATNVTRQQYIGDLPDPNVGQYDIQPLLAKLGETNSIQLQIPTRQNRPIALSIPTDVLEEWTTVGRCSYLICDTDNP